VEEVVAGNCSVKWSSVPHAEYYTTFIKSDDGIEGTCNSTEPGCQFHCSCGYSYIMSVFAHNQAGPSPPGPLVNHTTCESFMFLNAESILTNMILTYLSS